MTIKIETENCNFQQPYLFQESADSKIKITLEFQKIVSVQSKKIFLDALISSIQNELQKFEWLVCGKFRIEIHWLLNSVQRQETDKFGDLDNVTKPIIDSMGGKNGIFIDDSQINSIHTTWTTRSQLNNDGLVFVFLNFINDWTVLKKDLFFLQISKEVFTPLNFRIDSQDELFKTKLFEHAIRAKRRFATKFKQIGANVDRYLIYSEYDFHRTRLNGFDKKQILSTKDFNRICLDSGVTFAYLINHFRIKSI